MCRTGRIIKSQQMKRIPPLMHTAGEAMWRKQSVSPEISVNSGVAGSAAEKYLFYTGKASFSTQQATNSVSSMSVT